MKNKIIIPLLAVGLACTSCAYQEGKSYKLEDLNLIQKMIKSWLGIYIQLKM